MQNMKIYQVDAFTGMLFIQHLKRDLFFIWELLVKPAMIVVFSFTSKWFYFIKGEVRNVSN